MRKAFTRKTERFLCLNLDLQYHIGRVSLRGDRDNVIALNMLCSYKQELYIHEVSVLFMLEYAN
jgi:hypothetical protein